MVLVPQHTENVVTITQSFWGAAESMCVKPLFSMSFGGKNPHIMISRSTVYSLNMVF